MPEIELLNTVIEVLTTFGVSGVFIWQAIRWERKYDALHAQYIADLREIAGLRHALRVTQQEVRAYERYGGNGEKTIQLGQTKANGD